MQAGTIAILPEETAAERLKSFQNGLRALDVQKTLAYLDEARVQQGRVMDMVETQDEHVFVDGEAIEVEREDAEERVWTDWIADVTDAGFVAAERTTGSDPTFPFDIFRARTGVVVEPAYVNVPAFADAQDDLDVWLVGRKELDEDGLERQAVNMDYNDPTAAQLATDANVGLGFRTAWNSTMVRGVLYASGYLALYDNGVGPIQFARFVREEVIPHAYVPGPEDEPEQATLDSGVSADD